MDSVRNKKARVVKKDVKSKGRGTDSRVKAKVSRALKKPADCEKSKTCRNVKKVAEEKIRQSLYSPVKEHLLVLVEYIDILDRKQDGEEPNEIYGLHELITLVSRQCLTYLNYKYMQREDLW